MQKPWCLLRAGAYLEKWVADNEAGTYGAPPAIPLLTSMVGSEPVWAEDMAVEWQAYAPAPPVRIEVGPPKKRNRVEPQAVCGDRPPDVIPQPAGAPALPAPVSDDHEMGLGAGAPALPTPVHEEDDEAALPELTDQAVRDDMVMRAILRGDRPWQSQPGAGARALPTPVNNAEEEPRPALGVGAPALLAPPVRRRPAAAAAAPPVAPALLAPQARVRPAAAAAAPAARPATGAKARAKAHVKPNAKARPKAHAKAHAEAHPAQRTRWGLRLGCSKCKWSSCSQCRDLGWRQRRAAREAAS